MAHLVKRWKRKRPIGQEVDIIFRPGEKLYSKALKRSRWQTRPPNLIFHFSNESLPLLSHIPYLLVPPPQKKILFQLPHRDRIKINSHNPGSWNKKQNKKGVKSNTLPFPSATQLSATSLWLSPRLSSKWRHTHPHARTHFHTKRTSAQRNTRSQSLVEREGDANRGGLWTMAAISTPRPAPALPCPAHPPQTTMNKWSHDIRCFHLSHHCSDSHRQRIFFFLFPFSPPSPLSPHNFWIFSATTMGFSLRMRAAAALR